MKQDHIQHNLKCLFNGPDPCRTRAARYLKVLAHPDRMKILWYLNDSEKSVNDLVNYTNIKQTTLSQHLSLLKDRELVESRREGSYVFPASQPEGHGHFRHDPRHVLRYPAAKTRSGS